MSNVVPEGWTIKSLADVSTFIMGQAPHGSTCNKDGEGAPFVKAGEFSTRYPVIREWTTNPLKTAEYGDVLICVVGATAGKLNLGIDSAIGRSVAAIRPTDTTTLYLYNFMQQHVEKLRDGSSGSAQGVITREHLKDIVAPFPPLPEQQKIAAILSSVDDVIEKTQAQIDKLKDLKTGMMQELLTKGIGHTEYKDSPVGQIPVGWVAMTVGDVGSQDRYSIVDGPFGSSINTKRDYISEGVPVIRTVNIRPFKFIEDDLKFISDELFETIKRSAVYPDDVLLSKVGTIGYSCLLPDHIPKAMLSTTGSCKLTVDKTIIHPEFLCYLLNQMKPYMDLIASEGVQPFLNMQTIKSFWLRVPPLKEQESILDVLNSISMKIDVTNEKLENARAIKKALMQDLLTGTVRVKVD